VSENDSFLSEVTEEVRRDELTSFLRKHAILIGAGLAIIIGGAAYLEWSRASTRAAAEARGDAIWAALDLEAGEDRIAALADVEMTTPDGVALLDFQRAASFLNSDQREQAVEALQAIASRGGVSEPIRNVARLKLVGVGAGVLSVQDRQDVLLPMLQENHAMRALALEQRAYLLLESGDVEAAVADLEEIGNDARASGDVRARADRLLSILVPDQTANG